MISFGIGNVIHSAVPKYEKNKVVILHGSLVLTCMLI
jgi:hypothetical protein